MLKQLEAGGDNNITLKNMSSNLRSQEEKVKPSDGVCSVCKGTGVLTGSHPWPLEGGRKPHTPDRSLEFSVYYY